MYDSHQPKHRRYGKDRYEPTESSFQTVIAGLNASNPPDTDSYRAALAEINSFLLRIAKFFLRGESYPSRREEVALEIRQDWHINALGGGYGMYLQNSNGRPFTPYCIRMVQRLCIDRWRKGERSLAIELPDDFSDPRQNNPVEAAELREFRRDCRAALKALPPHERYCLVLIHFEQVSRSEAADRMKTNPNTVSTWNSRGRAKLARVFQDRGHWPLCPPR